MRFFMRYKKKHNARPGKQDIAEYGTDTKTELLFKIAIIIFYLLSVLTVYLIINTPIFTRTYGMEFAHIISVPLPRFNSRIASLIITVILAVIIYLILFKINGSLYKLMNRFFIKQAFLLPVCVFFVFLLLVSNKIMLDRNMESNVILYMSTIFINMLLNYISILLIIDSVFIQYRLVKTVMFDIIRTKNDFANEDISIIISTYLNFVFTFATLYFFIQLSSQWTAFKGIDKAENLFETVVNCVYFSVITISTTGFGEIYPLLWYTKLLVSIEVLSGVLLLTFSFGIIMNSISQNNAVHRHNKRQPILSEHSVIISKNSRSHQQKNYSAIITLNYATFNIDNGERMVLKIPDNEFDLMLEGDTGSLTFQGSQFICFSRDKHNELATADTIGNTY